MISQETWQRRPGSESWDDALWPTVEATQEAFLATLQSTSYHSVSTYPDDDNAQIPVETLARPFTVNRTYTLVSAYNPLLINMPTVLSVLSPLQS